MFNACAHTQPGPRTRHAGSALFAMALLAPCAGVLAAPAAGERYEVDGRCVTLSRVSDEQAWYAWSNGNRSGEGNLPAAWLGRRCEAQAATAGAAPERPAEPAAPTPQRVSPPGATAAIASGDDVAFRDEILRAHNQVRCMHGAPTLSWHPDVAAYAQNWVARGVFRHSDSYRADIGPLAENLYGSSGQPSPAAAVESWYGESRGYNYVGEGSSASGHFTALIWKDAKYLGCARSNGILSCNYWSGTKGRDCSVPNMQGCYQQQVLPASRDAMACGR